jgi:protein-S-isoprenylcysteine O-methyltransferase Ste14
MKLKSTKREYSDSWVQTAVLVVTLVLTLLGSFGVLTPAQTAEATPIISTTFGLIGTVIASVIQLIGIFVKATPTA